MTIRRASIALATALLFFALPALAASADLAAAKLDRVASSYFKADGPGAAILVMKDGKALLRKGYGMADLEQHVPMKPDDVFRIGSVTKQFTAVAILQLVAQGKIGLDDEITKYLPDYPMQGKKISVENLLTHTSGIADYTDVTTYELKMRDDVSVPALIDRFKSEPMVFSPGEKWAYSNSNYVLLGAIVEKVSGQKYSEYLQKNVFPRAGLTSTFDGDAASIIPHRIPGYHGESGRVVNAPYISMTQPYAAGALVSTVDDLARWTMAVADGKVLDPGLVERAWTSTKTNDGKPTGYGYGWAVIDLFGARTIAHDGGINGFVCSEMWIPEQKVFVAVMENTDAPETGPDFIAGQLASFAIGKPWNPVAVKLPDEQLAEYAGVYRIDEKTTRTISVDKGQVFSQRSGGPKFAIHPSARDTFFFEKSFTVFKFERDASGKLVAMTTTGLGGSRAVKTDEKPVAKTEIAVDASRLDRYVGHYELAPGFILAVTRKGDQLWTQATGQQEIQIFAQAESEWFLKVVDAQLTFHFDDKGNATSLTLHQGGQNIDAKKLP